MENTLVDHVLDRPDALWSRWSALAAAHAAVGLADIYSADDAGMHLVDRTGLADIDAGMAVAQRAGSTAPAN